MKTLFISVILTLLALAATAEHADSVDVKSGKLYLGASFSTVSHNIYYKSPKSGSNTVIAHFAPLSLNVGYRFNERTSIQAGVAYGGSSDHVDWMNNDGTTRIDSYGKTNVIAVPLTVRHVFFKLFRRLPVYAAATFMPAYGITKTKITETKDNVTTTTTDVKDAGINTYFTAGVGLNYKITGHFNGFFEYYAYKHNFNGKNSVYYDWDQGMRGIDKVIRSVGIGLNYNL